MFKNWKKLTAIFLAVLLGVSTMVTAFAEEEIGPLPLCRIGRELILFTPVGKCDEKFRAASPTPGEDFPDVRGVEPVQNLPVQKLL